MSKNAVWDRALAMLSVIFMNYVNKFLPCDQLVDKFTAVNLVEHLVTVFINKGQPEFNKVAAIKALRDVYRNLAPQYELDYTPSDLLRSAIISSKIEIINDKTLLDRGAFMEDVTHYMGLKEAKDFIDMLASIVCSHYPFGEL